MKIAILSDIHENIPNLVKALGMIKEMGCERILFLGDFINPGVVKVIAAQDIPVRAVWGNNDGDKVSIMQIALHPKSSLTMADGVFDSLEIDGRKIFMTHFPQLADVAIKAGFDAVFYGHDHDKVLKNVGSCLLLNPGEISAHKTGESTFAVYNTQTNDAEIISVADPVSLKSPEAEAASRKASAFFKS
ncbi:MAG: metallophosphoesterase [Nanoarchaeota archaeon]